MLAVVLEQVLVRVLALVLHQVTSSQVLLGAALFRVILILCIIIIVLLILRLLISSHHYPSPPSSLSPLFPCTFIFLSLPPPPCFSMK